MHNNWAYFTSTPKATHCQVYKT